jgi:acetyltransferase-like isoleucine patch superfamily enzyme
MPCRGPSRGPPEVRGPGSTAARLDHRGASARRGSSYHRSVNRARRLGGKRALGAYRLAVRARAKVFSLLVSGAFASYGRHSVLEPPIRIGGEERIAVGDNVYVGAGCWLQVLGDDAGPPAIVIGDGTSIAGRCVISAAQSVRLGSEVLVASGVYIADHSHAFEDASRPVLGQGIDRVAPVEVGDGAWLGENVVVGPGVRVGRGAVVGANAVVLEDVPDRAVAVGVPARVVRRLSDDAQPVR